MEGTDSSAAARRAVAVAVLKQFRDLLIHLASAQGKEPETAECLKRIDELRPALRAAIRELAYKGEDLPEQRVEEMLNSIFGTLFIECIERGQLPQSEDDWKRVIKSSAFESLDRHRKEVSVDPGDLDRRPDQGPAGEVRDHPLEQLRALVYLLKGTMSSKPTRAKVLQTAELHVSELVEFLVVAGKLRLEPIELDAVPGLENENRTALAKAENHPIIHALVRSKLNASDVVDEGVAKTHTVRMVRSALIAYVREALLLMLTCTGSSGGGSAPPLLLAKGWDDLPLPVQARLLHLELCPDCGTTLGGAL